MRGGRNALTLALALLIAGPVAAQEAPPLPVTEAPVDEGAAPDGPPAATPDREPIVVPGLVQGQPGAVVTVDQDRLFSGSAWGRRIQAEFEQAGTELAAENDRLAKQLSDEEAALTEARATLDPAEFRSRAEAFDARATEIRRERAQAVQDLNASGDAEQNAFFQAIVPLIGRVMLERGAVVVLDRRSVLMSADGIDITGDLITQIDAELGDGSDLPAPQPAPEPEAPAAPEGAGN